MSVVDELLERVTRLEQQVHDLAAAKEIQELQQRYLRALSDRNWDGVAEAYAEDAICDIRQHGPHRGRDAIAAMIGDELAPVVKSKDGYVLSSPTITVDGDTAYGEFIWHRFICEFRTSFGLMRVWGPWSEGLYKVHYRRIGGEWKISNLWTRVIRPDHDDDVAVMPEGAVIGGGFADPGAESR